MSEKKVWVRIINKQVEQFYRAGEKFTRDWKQVTLGEAEVTAIEHDQMLQISFTDPMGGTDYPDDLKTQLGLLLTVYSAQEIADTLCELNPDWANKMNKGVPAPAAEPEPEAQAIAAASETVAESAQIGLSTDTNTGPVTAEELATMAADSITLPVDAPVVGKETTASDGGAAEKPTPKKPKGA